MSITDNNKNLQQIVFNKENRVNDKDEVVSRTEENNNNSNKNNDNISSNEIPQFEISNGTSSNDFQISNGNEKMTIHNHELLHTTTNNNKATPSIDKTFYSINNNNNIPQNIKIKSKISYENLHKHFFN